MTRAPVVVMGATGNLGHAAVDALLDVGIPVRAGGRDPGSLSTPPGVEAVRLDVTDPTSFPAALDGASGLFVLRPPAVTRVAGTVNALIDAAVQAGVGHVVAVTVAGADTNRVIPHHRIETHLRGAGVAHTILRPGFFAQNLGDAYRCDIRDDDRLYVPAGQGRVAFVDVRDIGEAAARVFLDPRAHRGAGYHLTGPVAVTMGAVADRLSAALGRPIRYEAATVVGYVDHLRRAGLRPLPILVQTALHVGLRRGDAAPVEPSLERLLGRRPRCVGDYINDHVELWR